jgi:phosphoribosyl-ATP pyrophosphohydrolase
MAKTTKKLLTKAAPSGGKFAGTKLVTKKRAALPKALLPGPSAVDPNMLTGMVLDSLHATIEARKGADPSTSHSAKLMSRGRAKVAQKFGEEAVECLIEAVAGNRSELIAESADVLYHLMVIWVDAGVAPSEIWAELERRKGISGIAEKASRVQKLATAFGLGTSKIP